MHFRCSSGQKHCRENKACTHPLASTLLLVVLLLFMHWVYEHTHAQSHTNHILLCNSLNTCALYSVGNRKVQLLLSYFPYSQGAGCMWKVRVTSTQERFNRFWHLRHVALFVKRQTVCLQVIYMQPSREKKSSTKTIWSPEPDFSLAYPILFWSKKVIFI